MEVLHFEEVTGRDREEDIESNKRHRRTFQAITDTPQGGPEMVLAYVGVPLLGDILSYTDNSTGVPVLVNDPSVVVIRRRAEQTDGDNLCNWFLTVEYMGIDEPESQPAEVEYSPTPYQEHMVKDVNGVDIANGVGDPLAEGVERDRTRFTLTIVKNIVNEDWDPIEAEAFQDTLNLNAFLVGYFPAHAAGFPAGTCKLKVGAKRVRKKGLNEFYYQRTAVIDIDTRGWNAKVRNAGFRYFDAAAGEPRPIVLPGGIGVTPSLPVPLAEDGAVLPFGSAAGICNPPDGFVRYVSKNWTSLALEY